MSSTSRGARRLVSSIPSARHVCLSCRRAINRREYASAATAQATVDTPPITQLTPDEPAASPLPQPQFTVKAGIVLSRAPLLTPDLHPFEKAYYLYQRRLNERLVLPFTQYFYYKKGTPSFQHWSAKRRERNGTATRDIGVYNPYKKDGWNDEVLVGSEEAEPETVIKRLIDEEGRAEEIVGENGDKSMGGLTRTTEADRRNDQRSLERALSRTLYLLVKRKKGQDDVAEKQQWSFPSAVLEEREGMKEAAQRILAQSCGLNMNTWFVGNHPVGYLVRYTDYTGKRALHPQREPAPKSDAPVHLDEGQTGGGEKTFFMKARIFAGQADVKSNKHDLEDFKWLAKDEIQTHVTPSYWARVRNMLVDQ